jgi:hypothetical protein
MSTDDLTEYGRYCTHSAGERENQARALATTTNWSQGKLKYCEEEAIHVKTQALRKNQAA